MLYNSDSSSPQAQDEFENMVRNLDVKSRDYDQYVDWKGVRYRPAAALRKASTVPALYSATFREQFGLELPRSTWRTAGNGQSGFTHNLRTGDLSPVPRRFHWPSYVGIYNRHNQFVHVYQ